MCVVSPGRRNVSPFLHLSEIEYVAIGDTVKELLFLRQVWRFMITGKGIPCFSVFEDNEKVFCNSRKIQCRTQIQNTSMSVIIS